ncbi:MAG: hypothetical protein ACSHWN_05475 [Methylophilaceae bacterium]
MITIHNFNDTYQLYQLGLIAFRLLQEQAMVMLSICGKSSDALSISHQDIQWLAEQPESELSYMDMLGGDMHICEHVTDLQQIKGCDHEWAASHDGNWPNVTDIPLSWDVCCYLEEAEGDPQWVMFVFCWNNAGGPVYYVPKRLWELARVTEHQT